MRSLLTSAMLLALPLGLVAADLPEAPGKKAVERVCSQCHGVETFAAAHKSREEWDRTITSMVDKGLQITDEDYGTVIEYLAKNLGKEKKDLRSRQTAQSR